MPLIAWIPDFQHVHLPQMFSPKELVQRDQAFHRVIDRADRIILSSQPAMDDLARFSPQGAVKGRVLNFVAHLAEGVRDKDPGWVCPYYHLPERFVYLPNQFWAHKNHRLVLDAMEIVLPRIPELTIACTGNTNDWRNPFYFGELLAEVSARGLRDRFVVLGLVPHEHVFVLMRQCLCMLQPSLFEGWSTTVEEIKSLGKGAVISDIEVHRGQDPPQARFFDPQDAKALAGCLEEAWRKGQPGPDRDLEARAAAELPERSKRFGRQFLAVVREVVG
jgi:glycosyltransferase involved in cell wall biosynthesis